MQQNNTIQNNISTNIACVFVVFMLKGNTIKYITIKNITIKYNRIKNNEIQYNTIKYKKIQKNKSMNIFIVALTP